MQGLHLTADPHNCRCVARRLADANARGDWCADASSSAGMEPVGKLFQTFLRSGSTAGGVAVIRLLLGDRFLPSWTEQRSLDRRDES